LLQTLKNGIKRAVARKCVCFRWISCH